MRLYGTISNDLHALEKALTKIRQADGGARLEVCYEAGPCGFGIARRLAQLKVACQVVAPSMIPKRPEGWRLAPVAVREELRGT